MLQTFYHMDMGEPFGGAFRATSAWSPDGEYSLYSKTTSDILSGLCLLRTPPADSLKCENNELLIFQDPIFTPLKYPPNSLTSIPCYVKKTQPALKNR
jgi:hypothetical protein